MPMQLQAEARTLQQPDSFLRLGQLHLPVQESGWEGSLQHRKRKREEVGLKNLLVHVPENQLETLLNRIHLWF